MSHSSPNTAAASLPLATTRISTGNNASSGFYFDAQWDPPVGQVGDEMKLQLNLSPLEILLL
jgi:hypothetical protein